MHGSIAAAREWVLLRSDNGQIMSLLRDNRSGAVENCTMTQVSRGSSMSFILSEHVRQGTVKRGDTIGWVVSYDLLQEITMIEGRLAIAEADAASARSGEKSSLVEEAKQRLAFAKAACDEQEKLHIRQTELHEKHMVADELFEMSADRLKQLRINVELAEAGLRTASTGLKPEDIQAAETNVEALRKQLKQLQTLMQQNTFIAPVSGVQRTSWAVDTLLVISDISEKLLITVVELPDVPLLDEGSVINFSVPRSGLNGTAHIEYINPNVQYIRRRPVCTVFAKVDKSNAEISDGMPVNCSLSAASVKPLDWLALTLRRIFE